MCTNLHLWMDKHISAYNCIIASYKPFIKRLFINAKVWGVSGGSMSLKVQIKTLNLEEKLFLHLNSSAFALLEQINCLN